MVREDRGGSGEHVLQGHEQHFLDAGEVGLPDPPPGPFGDNRAEDRGLRGGTEQDLAADRRAEAADPIRVDIRSSLEILSSCDQVSVAGPANEVALASALSSRIEEEHSVPVTPKYARLLHGRRSGKDHDRGAVPGRDVRGGELEPVACLDGHGFVRDADLRRCSGAADVRVAVGERDRGDDEEREHDRSQCAKNRRQRPAEIAPAAASAGAPGLPERHRCAEQQDGPGDDREQPCVVIARGAPIQQVVRTRHTEGDADPAEGQRQARADTRPEAVIEGAGESQDCERNEPACEVIARRRSGIRLEEVVVGDMERHNADREPRERSLASNRCDHSRHAGGPSLGLRDRRGAHGRLLGAARFRSKKAITRCSYSAGWVVMPAMCWPFGTSQICLGSPAAA